MADMEVGLYGIISEVPPVSKHHHSQTPPSKFPGISLTRDAKPYLVWVPLHIEWKAKEICGNAEKSSDLIVA